MGGIGSLASPWVLLIFSVASIGLGGYVVYRVHVDKPGWCAPIEYKPTENEYWKQEGGTFGSDGVKVYDKRYTDEKEGTKMDEEMVDEWNENIKQQCKKYKGVYIGCFVVGVVGSCISLLLLTKRNKKTRRGSASDNDDNDNPGSRRRRYLQLMYSPTRKGSLV